MAEKLGNHLAEFLDALSKGLIAGACTVVACGRSTKGDRVIIYLSNGFIIDGPDPDYVEEAPKYVN